MRLQRLLGILAILLKQRRVRTEYLAKQFEVSTRTIHRDLETLEQAGVPIVTFPGVNGGIEILDTYKLDKSVFLSEDFTTILSGLRSISGTLEPAVVNRTLAKLKALIPQHQAEQVELSGSKLYIDLKPWSMHPEFSPVFETVRQAVERDRLLTFSYTAREHSSTRRVVEPHQMILKEQTWYLRAYCRTREAFRTFRLQRIRDAEMLDESFIPRPFAQDLDDFKTWTHPRLTNVEIIADPAIRFALLEHCRPESMTELPDGKLHLDLPFVESEIGYGTLMQMGHLCEIVAPEHIRKEFIRRLDRLRSIYPQ